jgi:hypothetical protein
MEKSVLVGGVYDGIVVKENFTCTTVDKLSVFTDTPFDETIFIDADCSVVNDLNYLFDVFAENGSEISGIGGRTELDTGKKGIQFGQKAIQSFRIMHDYPNFNGGVYYYKKSETGVACVDFMMNELLPNYDSYELLGWKDSIKYDEPLVIVGMLKYKMKPVPVEMDIMRLVHDPETVKWDVNKHICSYRWYSDMVSPSIIHWKVGGTETYVYEKYDAIIRGQFYKQRSGVVFANKSKSFIKYKVYPKLLKMCPQLHYIVARCKR